MTRLKTATMTLAALGMTTFMAQGAYAMTCGEFMEMSEADRAAHVATMGGPAIDEEGVAEGTVQVETTGDATDIAGSGGLENAEQEARGADVDRMERIIENCSSDMDRDVADAAEHPTEKTD